MPIAAAVPIIVAITELTTAIRNVLPIASPNAADLSDVIICLYDSKVNPLSKLKFELPENE